MRCVFASSSRRAGGRRPGALRTGLLALCLVLGHAGPVAAISFQLDIASSTYQVQPTDTWLTLIAQHESETLLSSTSVPSVAGITSTLYAGVNQNYSMLIQTVLDVTASGTYDFQVGTDWGRGGVAAVIDNGTGAVISELVRTDDIWWANSWSNPDVFVTSVALSAGESYTVSWLGFEGCCGGAAEIRFAFDGGSFETLSETSVAPFVTPEPSSAVLLGLGIALLGSWSRRARASSWQGAEEHTPVVRASSAIC